MNDFTLYDFMEFCIEARRHPTLENIEALADWCQSWGSDLWQGEYYDVSLVGEPSGSCRLFPIYSTEEENYGEIINWELRRY